MKLYKPVSALLAIICLLGGCESRYQEEIDEYYGNTTTAGQTTVDESKNSTAKSDNTASGETTATTKTPDDTSGDTVSAFAAVPIYNNANSSDYVSFQSEHPDLTAEQVVTYVNIGLSRPFYTGIETVSNPDSLFVLSNKYNALPEDYEPDDLVSLSSNAGFAGRDVRMRKEAAEAFEKLAADAKEAGYTIIGLSGYRSYSVQAELYQDYVNSDGVEAADTYSARAGHSEHQTGLVIDVTNLVLAFDQFGETDEYEWVKDKLHNYGFIIRYTPEGEWITGFQPEAWHFRYVGVDAATEIYEKGITLDEYVVANSLT